MEPVPAAHVKNVVDTLIGQLANGRFPSGLAQLEVEQGFLEAGTKPRHGGDLGIPELINCSIVELSHELSMVSPGVAPPPNGHLAKHLVGHVGAAGVDLNHAVLVAWLVRPGAIALVVAGQGTAGIIKSGVVVDNSFVSW